MTPGTRLINLRDRSSGNRAVGTATRRFCRRVESARNPIVKVKAPEKTVPQSRSRSTEIKANRLFADSPLVRIGRLSVVPLNRRTSTKIPDRRLGPAGRRAPRPSRPCARFDTPVRPFARQSTGACVTIRIVCPSWGVQLLQQPEHDFLRSASSRFPVGSSARIPAWVMVDERARGNRHSLLLPAG